MHTAPISRIGIDADNRYIVTGSDDKTVKVWELYSGKLISTLRVPIDDGDVGKIYSVAISPDGKTIACGGWTGYESDNSIYLFDRETGKIKQTITGLPNVILHLSYSKDGRFLAATLGGKNGIRVYKTTNYSQIASDTDYGDTSYGADFDKNGRLVTSSYDGNIRLYDSTKTFNLIQKVKSKGGNRPFSVAFSPDGSKIAVGFRDTTNVDVLSGKDLSHLSSPDTSDVNKNFSSVTFSLDGKYLYAGGMANKGGQHYIRKWSQAGEGGFTDLTAPDNTIMQIIPLKDGGLPSDLATRPLAFLEDTAMILGYRKMPGLSDFGMKMEVNLQRYFPSLLGNL
jgi:WD40 repeat protein